MDGGQLWGTGSLFSCNLVLYRAGGHDPWVQGEGEDEGQASYVCRGKGLGPGLKKGTRAWRRRRLKV